MREKVTPGPREAGARGGEAPGSKRPSHTRPSDDGLLALEGDANMRAARVAQTLLASARHELRSPLQALLGFAELLDSGSYGALSAPQQAFLGHMRTAGLELTHTIDICTQIAAAYTAPAPPSDETCALQDVLDMALIPAAEPGPVRTTLNTSVDTALHARGSKEALLRCIGLVISALTPNAKAAISVSTTTETAFFELDFTTDRADPGDQELHEIDDLLAEGAPSRSTLLLKLAALLLEPFAGSVACSVMNRRVRIGLSRT